MKTIDEQTKETLFKPLKMACEKCFGLCCVALYYAASEGFPKDKSAGEPCIYLEEKFLCGIHTQLKEKGLHGCCAYECMGAGQKVAQHTYKGQDWRQHPQIAKQMFDVFLIMRQLHEMLWYLTEAYCVIDEEKLRLNLASQISKLNEVTTETPEALLKVELEACRQDVNTLLHQTSALIGEKARKKHGIKTCSRPKSPFGYMGKDLRKVTMIGADLSGNVLIAANLRGVDLTGANLIGADLRDTDLRGANLQETLFLTQMQLESAKGDSKTKLPSQLKKPSLKPSDLVLKRFIFSLYRLKKYVKSIKNDIVSIQ